MISTTTLSSGARWGQRARCATAPFLLFLTALLCGCRSAPLPQPTDGPVATVYVVKRAWHIDIGFDARDLQPPLSSMRGVFPSARVLEFGFGDRQYLMSRNKGTGSLLWALWPGPGLLLMTALKDTPDTAFGAANVVRLAVSRAQLTSIQESVWKTVRTAGDTLVPAAPGPYAGSVFFEATQHYSAFHTCNTWAAEVLQSAGLPIGSAGVEFSGQVWSQVQRLAHP